MQTPLGLRARDPSSLRGPFVVSQGLLVEERGGFAGTGA